MKARDWLQQTIYKIINPLVHGLVKVGVTPNMVTATGCVINIIAAAVFVYGGFTAEGYSGMGDTMVPAAYDNAILIWAGAILLFGSLFDMIDGQVARLGKMCSTYGALFDSVLDRYSELITLFGICFYFFMMGHPVFALVTFLAMVGSLMVSYVRARAEGLGLKCDVGLMQRPERVVLTSVGSLFAGIFGCIWVLVVPLILIALLANVTAFVRMNYAKKQIKQREQQG
jgi:CDP-diacylglycerol---glycerol-3-phosphate 3-phosphatidyltransferase